MTLQTNIIILDSKENLIGWLKSELAEIIETNKKETQRTVKITYPLSSDVHNDLGEWYKQGNKIYIPDTLGVDACLYVINTKFNIDYWDTNKIVVNAEEVLVELNYVDLYKNTSTSNQTVSKDMLNKIFGNWYEIGDYEAPPNSYLRKLTLVGTMTRLSVLRQIEKQTSNIFVTEYSIDKDNTIKRVLHFKQQKNLGRDFNTVLDLSYNMDSLEYEVDESNTYKAIAPLISDNSNNATTMTTGTASTNQLTIPNQIQVPTTITDTATTTATQKTKTLKEVITAWEELEVSKGQLIPMIMEQNQTTGEYETTAEWNAPFNKDKGSLAVVDDVESGTNYNQVYQYKENKFEMKTGTVSTTATEPYVIYNRCANALIEKRYPDMTIAVDMKDLETLLEGKNVVINLYDNFIVKVPGFDKYIPASVTSTEKNPHEPGSNKISLETTVGTRVSQKATTILSNDRIIPQSTPTFTLQGQLLVEGEPLANQTVSINIALTQNTPSTTGENQPVLEFKTGASDEYYFTDPTLKIGADYTRTYFKKNSKYPETVELMATDNKYYKVPLKWLRAMFNSMYAKQIHDDDGTKVFKGSEWIDMDQKSKVWYYYKQHNTNYSRIAHDIQQENSIPACLSMLSQDLYFLYNENDWTTKLKSTSEGISMQHAIEVAKTLEFTVTTEPLNETMIQKYLPKNNQEQNKGYGILIQVIPSKLSWWSNIQTNNITLHTLYINAYEYDPTIGTMNLKIHDPKFKSYNPTMTDDEWNKYNNSNPDGYRTVAINDIKTAVDPTYNAVIIGIK